MIQHIRYTRAKKLQAVHVRNRLKNVRSTLPHHPSTSSSHGHCTSMADERHGTDTRKQTQQREHLSSQPAPPHHGVHHKIAREHLDARRVHEHAGRHRGHEALDLLHLRRVVMPVVYERDEADRDADGNGHRKGKGEDRFEDACGDAPEGSYYYGVRLSFVYKEMWVAYLVLVLMGGRRYGFRERGLQKVGETV